MRCLDSEFTVLNSDFTFSTYMSVFKGLNFSFPLDLKKKNCLRNESDHNGDDSSSYNF